MFTKSTNFSHIYKYREDQVTPQWYSWKTIASQNLHAAVKVAGNTYSMNKFIMRNFSA